MYSRIMKLKKINKDLKIMLGIGGWDAGSYPFDEIVVDENTINLFANNAVTFLRKWNFDGLGIIF